MKPLLCFKRDWTILCSWGENKKPTKWRKTQGLQLTRKLMLLLILVKSPSASSLMKPLASVTTQLHAWESRAAQRLTVALRPISPHCQTVVSRKRETKAEAEAGGDVFKHDAAQPQPRAGERACSPRTERRRTKTDSRAADRLIRSVVPFRHRHSRNRVRMMKCGENGSKCRRA